MFFEDGVSQKAFKFILCFILNVFETITKFYFNIYTVLCKN